MITNRNELVKLILCGCKCRFDIIKCNSNQKQNEKNVDVIVKNHENNVDVKLIVFGILVGLLVSVNIKIVIQLMQQII